MPDHSGRGQCLRSVERKGESRSAFESVALVAAALALAGLSYGCGGSVDSVDMSSKAPPAGYVGVTSPTEVFRYRDAPHFPPNCRDPRQMLELVQRTIRESAMQGAVGACSADLREQPFILAQQLEIVCELINDGSCRHVYMARLWAERESGSTVNYTLKGFGLVQRACETGVFDKPEASTLISAGTSEAILNALEGCRG